jgi:hypothetical protein
VPRDVKNPFEAVAVAPFGWYVARVPEASGVDNVCGMVAGVWPTKIWPSWGESDA